MTEDMPSRKKTVEHFDFLEILGEGSYGDVIRCVDKSSKQTFAAKKINKNHLIKEKKTKYALLEREIMSECNHPNIVKLFYSFRDESHLYYIMELASNGELLSQLKKHGNFSTPSTTFIAAELLSALEYLHSRGIIHRDLKPENVLLSDDFHVKLGDFGTAKRLKENEVKAFSNSFVGTAEYISPEALNPENKSIYKASDLWAYACIIYQMIVGKPPFKGSNQHLTFEKVMKGKVRYPKNMPEHARNLIEKLLVLEPEERLGYNSLDEIKEHPFFESIKWDELHTMEPPPLKPLEFELEWKSKKSKKKKKHSKQV